MFTKHHVTPKKQEKFHPSDVPCTPNFGPSAHQLKLVLLNLATQIFIHLYFHVNFNGQINKYEFPNVLLQIKSNHKHKYQNYLAQSKI